MIYLFNDQTTKTMTDEDDGLMHIRCLLRISDQVSKKFLLQERRK